MELIGKVLQNRYEIIEKIGTGGMADVYKARCNLLDRYVAIKVLKTEYSKDETFLKRFRTEAQSAAKLAHPNIVSIYDVGEEDGINYIVMELLDGKTLKDYIEEHGKLSNDEIIKLSIQIASGLEAAHKEHIVHRDIKPQNIMLGKNMIAKVTDFGIAKVTTTATITNFGSTMGSVHYFSPEHAKGGYTDEKSDIYSLGIVMYEMATGRVPFDGDSQVAVALKHIQERPIAPNTINPALLDSLNEIILKCMAKSAINRYQSATELLEDLESVRESKRIKKASSSIEAGETQVIPIITDDMLTKEDMSIPNIRTKNSSKPNVQYSSLDNVRENTNTNNVIEEKKNYKEKNNADVDEDVKELNLRKKDKKLMAIVIIIAVIICLAILGVFGVKIYRKVQEARKQNEQTEYIVEDLVGKNYEEMKAIYAEKGITLTESKRENSAEIEKGSIISQSIAKDTVTTAKEMSVVVSSGPKMVMLTDVKGKDLKVARYELETNLGFVVEIKEEISEMVAAGIVISQEQTSGEEYEYGSTITLVVSKGDGKTKVNMPSILGMTEVNAINTLESLGLVVKKETGEDTSKSNGQVIAQSYPQNQELSQGDVVTITINKCLVTKNVTIDFSSLKVKEETPVDDSTSADEDTETKEETEVKVQNITISVKVQIDGSSEDTRIDGKVIDLNSTVTQKIEVSGYTQGIVKVFVNGDLKSTQNIDFTNLTTDVKITI